MTRPAALTAVLGLVLAMPLVEIATAPAAHAAPGDVGSSVGAPVYASSGSGAHRDSIAWLSWGAVGAPVANNATVTNWHEVGGNQRVEVSCTLTGLAAGATMSVYEPGSYRGDGLDELYGGVRAGLSSPDGQERSFTVGCTAALVEYDGSGWAPTNRGPSRTVQLGGLVFADAESMNSSEFVRARAADGALSTPWRIIDRYNGGCDQSVNTVAAEVPAADTRTVTLRATRGECASGTPNAVLMADGVQTLAVTQRGSGVSAVAIGYVLGTDYGDAPAAYGVASGLLLPTWTGGQLGVGTRDVAGYVNDWCTIFCARAPITSPAVALVGEPQVSLGASARTNRTVPHSPGATGDVQDEDAFGSQAAPTPSVFPGASTFTTSVRCRGTAATRVAGWIDWNRNGTFEPGERSSVSACSDTTAGGAAVPLVWAVPADAVPGATFLRLRVSVDGNDLGSPVGASLRGEVEDWALTVRAALLAVAKTADATEVPAAGGSVGYTVTLTNTGDVAFTGENPAHLTDDVAGAVDDASLGAVSVAPTTAGAAAVDGSRITWSGPLAPGASIVLTYRMTVRAVPGDRIMTNLARGTTQAVAAGTPVTCDLGSQELAARRCARVQLWALGLTLTKQAFQPGSTTPIPSGTELAPGTAVVWRYTVTNTGSAPLTDVRLTDSWQETRTTAAGTVATAGVPTITCPDLAPPGTAVVIPRLAANTSVTCTATGVVVPHP